MKRFFFSVTAAAAALLFAVAPAAAASNNNSWHRLNADQSNPGPEYERLTCAKGPGLLLCQYDKVKGSPEWNNTVARFKGRNVTASWTCPDWFGADVCAAVTKVWSGHARYWPTDAPSFEVDQDMVILDWHGQKVMYQYWHEPGFACPWFRSIHEALAANPNRDFDCLVP